MCEKKHNKLLIMIKSDNSINPFLKLTLKGSENNNNAMYCI